MRGFLAASLFVLGVVVTSSRGLAQVGHTWDPGSAYNAPHASPDMEDALEAELHRNSLLLMQFEDQLMSPPAELDSVQLWQQPGDFGPSFNSGFDSSFDPGALSPGETPENAQGIGAGFNNPGFFKGGSLIEAYDKEYYRFPGSDFLVKAGGLVQADFIHDFDPILDREVFVTPAIETNPRRDEENFDASARPSRLFVETLYEVDFYGPQLYHVFADVNFRGRNRKANQGQSDVSFINAYAEVGNVVGGLGVGPGESLTGYSTLLVGQTFSTFSDISAFPVTLDFAGPDALVFNLDTQIRWTQLIMPGLTASFGVERPFSDITTPTGVAGRRINPAPDLAVNVRYQLAQSHVQFAGIRRRLAFQPTVGPRDTVTGHGFSISGVIYPFVDEGVDPESVDVSEACQKDQIFFQVTRGEGIANFINGPEGLGLDAAPGFLGMLQPIPITAWFVAYQHWFTESLAINGTYSTVDISAIGGQDPSTLKRTQYVNTNVVWLPLDRVGIGLGYLYGTRTNQDGAEGDANRAQLTFQFTF